MTTGWFGIPGKTPPVDAKVHVFHLGRTLCGWKPEPPYEFQFCAHGINLPMIECARCRVIAGKYLAMDMRYTQHTLFPDAKVSLFSLPP